MLEYISNLETKHILETMHYVGVDIIEIARIKRAIERWEERFLHRVYSEPELRLCRKKPSPLAVRFAGTGTKGISWREIEILAEPSGKPVVQLSGKAQDKANSLGMDTLAISLSHSREYAIAFVVGEAK